ncbi:YqaA family protein [Fluviicola sp.]|jgi:membrane protein YqaA with SNARE-associated domain|uniref:YqaA family protein n=1 Tax=Fluviicola sp. TaxID=1917219 RepID=UPI002622476E|nr:YqaA family protein [Fluviicola sp.]
MIEWGLIGLFGMCFLASTIIPFPSEASLLFFLNMGTYSPVSILIVASLGNCLGGITNYLLGYYGRKILSKKQLLKSESLIQRYGFWAALISWLPIIGDPLLVVLGIYRVSFWKTLALMSIGKVGRYLIVYWTYFTFA